ncbi:organic anion transporting polypeptide 33Ea isoform X2 [Rhodnius prolixus]|uniref:organic anion transporting polypeptide 33Ea isoform X2 n=1 Tax=Rhodnius prolixus TaxID=13249 RepID=UPI003D18E1AE
MTDTPPISENDCGLGKYCRPRWLQGFATPTTFMVVYGLLGTIQAMSYVYIISTLTTIERRFGIPSKTTGMMLSGNEISQILLSLLLSYIGGQRNRPLWLAWGVCCSALSCYVLALPHFIYGPGEKALSLTQEYIVSHGINQTSLDLKERMGLCSEDSTPKDCNAGDYSALPPVLIFLSQFILGIGTTLYYSLGQTYIDDNTKKTKTPMILGLTLALRTIGPSLGFFIGYLCLNIYVDPWSTPLIQKKDPRWIGAWWIGWLVLGTIMFVFSFLLAMFPKQMRKTENIQISHKEKIEIGNNIIKVGDVNSNGNIKENLKIEPAKINDPPTLKDFPAALKRLIKNKLLVINIFSGVFYVLGASGYITYITKYIEVQFHKSSARANIIVGPAILLSMVLGFILSGAIISKAKPTPKFLLGWNVVVGIFFIVGEITYMFISCEDPNLIGYNKITKSVDVHNVCNANCSCENLKYAPVCLEERGLTFYSACHAGCHSTIKKNLTHIYSNCTCIPDENVLIVGLENNTDRYRYTTYSGELIEGPCDTPCGYHFYYFIMLSCLMQLLGSSGKIGNILVNYRAVSRVDKSFAQGLALLLVSLFAFIPGPVLFGGIIDSTCLIWDDNCGKRGNCWFYDKTSFRITMNTYAACLTSLGVLLDAIVCYLGKDLKLYDEDDEKE